MIEVLFKIYTVFGYKIYSIIEQNSFALKKINFENCVSIVPFYAD